MQKWRDRFDSSNRFRNQIGVAHRAFKDDIMPVQLDVNRFLRDKCVPLQCTQNQMM